MASKSSLASLLTVSLTTLTNADIPVSIFSYTPYLQQRECVKDCIWHSGSTAQDLIVALGCSGPWVNECYCSSNGNGNGNDNYEHASTASAFLRSCVAESCRTPSTNSLVTSAFDVYNEYCVEAGMAIPLVVASTTGSGAEVTSKGTESGERGEPTAGVGSGSGMSDRGPGLPTGAKVGIAVGAAASALALVVSAVITWRFKLKARISRSKRKDAREAKANNTGRTEIPQLPIIRHSGLPAATTRYN